jgi:hypothetical protein
VKILADEVAKYATAIDGYLGKIDGPLERSRKQQVDIAKLKTRTREVLAEFTTLRIA